MKIINALKILAATKDVQKEYLLKIGTFPSTDELALQFSDAYSVYKVKLKEQNDDLSAKGNLLKKFNEIDLLFDEMSSVSNYHLWNVSSLDKKEWNEVRSLANNILKLISNNS